MPTLAANNGLACCQHSATGMPLREGADGAQHKGGGRKGEEPSKESILVTQVFTYIGLVEDDDGGGLELATLLRRVRRHTEA